MQIMTDVCAYRPTGLSPSQLVCCGHNAQCLKVRRDATRCGAVPRRVWTPLNAYIAPATFECIRQRNEWQNRKYITLSPDEDRATATGNMYVTFREIWTGGFRYMRADRESGRQTDINPAILGTLCIASSHINVILLFLNDCGILQFNPSLRSEQNGTALL